MKKLLLSFTLMLLPLMASASRKGFTLVDGFYYEFYSYSHTASVCCKSFDFRIDTDPDDYMVRDIISFYGAGYSGSLEIPPEVTYKNVTYKVTSINAYAFSGCSGLTSITIPDGVYIGAYAFQNCSSLTSITIPDGVVSIGDNAFQGCSSLNSITFPNSVASIGSFAFQETAWYDNQPDGLVYAGKNAYKYKGEMPQGTNINIEDGTLSISDYAFSGCNGLTSVVIPNSVKKIGSSAFNGCSSLKSVELHMKNINYFNSTSVEEIIIGDEVETISSTAFDGTAWYNKQPEGLVYVDKWVYKYKGEMPQNTNITIQDGTVGICKDIFSGCSSLTSITIPDDVKTVGDRAFKGCSSLTSITIPTSLETIGEYAFFGCSNLTSSLIIPSNVKTIPAFAFQGCSSLTSITIPDGVETIGKNAFSGCTNLTSSLIIPSTVKTISESAFQGCSSLISITIPDGVETIGKNAFTGCKNLTSITIPTSLETIPESAFSGCSSLTSITIPDGVTTVGDRAFIGCSSLKSVTIGSEVKSIGEDAFSMCYDEEKMMTGGGYDGLSSVYCLAKEAPSGFEIAFDRDFAEEITLLVPMGSLDSYKSAEAKIYDGYGHRFKVIKELFKKESTTYSIDESNNVAIEEVEPAEETVDIPASVTVEGEAYPVTAIADNAFEGNTVIKQVSIPESIEEIGDAAFSGCSDLNTITCHAEEPIALGSAMAMAKTRAAGDESTPNVFNGVNKVTCLLYVPVASVSKYKATDGWKDFKYIVGIGSGFIIGDINGDKELDDKDVHALINHVMGNPQEGTFDKDMADVNQDGHVDVNDVVFLVKLLGQK